MAHVQKGDRVRINFTGTLEDGSVFDTTLEDHDCSSDDCSSDDCSSDECGCHHGPMELTLGAEEFFGDRGGCLDRHGSRRKKDGVHPRRPRLRRV